MTDRSHPKARFALALAAAAALGGAAARPAEAMQLGFYDPLFGSTVALERTTWLDRARDAGATVVKLDLRWALIAPSRPANASDPADPAYRWTTPDAAIADATQRGLRVLVTIAGAPRWAEQGKPPKGTALGAWQPRPTDLAAFARAAATRYRGSVRAWQIWNEPNLSTHLAPQWKHGRPFAPTRYRELLNAAFVSLKAVDPQNLVVTAGTAPYGDPWRGGKRIMPVRFWRELLCLDGRRCPPARFDAYAHHPYGVRGPASHARNADDVAVPDLGRITRLVRTAGRRGQALPRRPKQLWVTEISWDSSPPDPHGVPAARHAAWLTDALRVLDRQGADVVTWFRIRDQAPDPTYGATNQSGLYLLDGEPKPALAAWLAGARRLARRASRTFAAAIIGSASADTLFGTTSNDTIGGLGGDDVIFGLGRNDRIDGGAGDDTIEGDGVCPPGVPDVEYCRAGASGNDRIDGGGGDDRITAGAGRDVVDGGPGNDRIDGGGGNDRLEGGRGRDTLLGGAGSDDIRVDDGERDTVRCGAGRDSVRADRRDRINRDCERIIRRGRSR